MCDIYILIYFQFRWFQNKVWCQIQIDATLSLLMLYIIKLAGSYWYHLYECCCRHPSNYAHGSLFTGLWITTKFPSWNLCQSTWFFKPGFDCEPCWQILVGIITTTKLHQNRTVPYISWDVRYIPVYYTITQIIWLPSGMYAYTYRRYILSLWKIVYWTAVLVCVNINGVDIVQAWDSKWNYYH